MHVDHFWPKRLQDLAQLPSALQQHFGMLPQLRHMACNAMCFQLIEVASIRKQGHFMA